MRYKTLLMRLLSPHLGHVQARYLDATICRLLILHLSATPPHVKAAALVLDVLYQGVVEAGLGGT